MLNESMMSFLEGMQKSSPVILGLIIGCMSAFDMGGPVNKAAYVTGTMLLAQGNYLFMAGVSAACITPPLIIALAETFKKDRFTEEDRTAGLINYVFIIYLKVVLFPFYFYYLISLLQIHRPLNFVLSEIKFLDASHCHHHQLLS